MAVGTKAVFINNLRRLLAQQAISQVELGEKSGVLPQNINKYLNEKRVPSLDVIDRLAGALAVSPSELLTPEADRSVSSLSREELVTAVSEAAQTKGAFRGLSSSKISKLQDIVSRLGGWNYIYRFLREEIILRRHGEQKFEKLRRRLLDEAEEKNMKLKTKKSGAR